MFEASAQDNAPDGELLRANGGDGGGALYGVFLAGTAATAADVVHPEESSVEETDPRRHGDPDRDHWHRRRGLWAVWLRHQHGE